MNQIRVKMTSDPGVINEIALWAEGEDNVTIVEPVEEHPGPELGWDLATVANIVTIINFALYTGELVTRLAGSLRKHKTSINIQSPSGEVTIAWTGDLTEEAIRGMLQHILDPE